MRYHLDRCYVKSWSTSGDAQNGVDGFVFLGDPGGALRRLQVAIPAADDAVWRQLALAIRALEQAAAASGAASGKRVVSLDIAIG